MTWRGDVDVDRSYVPALSNRFTILFLAKILHTKTRYDFRFLATMSWNNK